MPYSVRTRIIAFRALVASAASELIEASAVHTDQEIRETLRSTPEDWAAASGLWDVRLEHRESGESRIVSADMIERRDSIMRNDVEEQLSDAILALILPKDAQSAEATVTDFWPLVRKLATTTQLVPRMVHGCSSGRTSEYASVCKRKWSRHWLMRGPVRDIPTNRPPTIHDVLGLIHAGVSFNLIEWIWQPRSDERVRGGTAIEKWHDDGEYI